MSRECLEMTVALAPRPWRTVALTSHALTVPVCLPEPEPPPRPDAIWAWGPTRAPSNIVGTTWHAMAQATFGTEWVLLQAGQIEGVAFWRNAVETTTSRQVGIYWWDGVSPNSSRLVVSTVGEYGEGWQRVMFPTPVRPLEGEDAGHFMVLVDLVNAPGSGFYLTQPWPQGLDSVTPALRLFNPRGASVSGLPPDGSWPNTGPTWPGVGIDSMVWVDVCVRPDV